MLLQEHLSRHPLDKEIAARWMKTFLKSLDPMKVYFYQSDVDEFTQRQDDLVKLIEKYDIIVSPISYSSGICSGWMSG